MSLESSCVVDTWHIYCRLQHIQWQVLIQLLWIFKFIPVWINSNVYDFTPDYSSMNENVMLIYPTYVCVILIIHRIWVLILSYLHICVVVVSHLKLLCNPIRKEMDFKETITWTNIPWWLFKDSGLVSFVVYGCWSSANTALGMIIHLLVVVM